MDARTGTAFDDMADDLDFVAPVADAPKTVRPLLHPFEQAGLGVSPFACSKVTTGQETACAYCGTRIKYAFHIASADGRTFVVGSDCVEKTQAAVQGFGAAQKQWKQELSRKQADARRAREIAKLAASLVDFRKTYPVECKWIDDNSARDGFARSLGEWLGRKGALTDGQLAAVRRSIGREIDRAEARQREQTKREETAPAVDTTQLEAAFAKALQRIRSPKITLGDLTFVPAKAESANAGAIYVKRGREWEAPYLGKILHGKFFASAACLGEDQKRVAEMVSDPKKTAEAYGIASGKCCLCNRTLTDPESIARGIGPICAENFGF